MKRFTAGVVTAAMLLSGCSGMGPRPVLVRAGVVDDEVRRNVMTSGPIYNFVQAELAARPYSSETSSATGVRPAIRNPDDPGAIRDMLDNGFTAIYASCDDFFRSAGRDQTRLLVFRDIILALSSMAGTALSLIDRDDEMGGRGNENALAALTLGSTALMTGVDIYTQRFLFGAENIDAVRELTMRALETHRNAVLFPTDRNVTPPATYDRVLVHLMDNQAKCSPRAISRLAREAIAAGNLEADAGTGSLRTQQNQTQDQRVLAELAGILDMTEPLTEQQAGALWWLLLAVDEDPALAPTDAEIAGQIKLDLEGLPASRRPIGDDGKRVPSWAPEARIRAVLRNLSEPTRTNFRRTVAAARAQQAIQIVAGANRGVIANGAETRLAPPVRPRFRAVAPVATDRRVTVRVASPD